MECSRCKSDRILHISARCKDQCTYEMKGNEGYGYPAMFGCGDNIEISVCLECGQVQEEFPYPESTIERYFRD